MLKKELFLLAMAIFFFHCLEAKEKTRVLYIVKNYPQISETYIHEEVASIWDSYEVKIVSFRDSSCPRINFYPYELISIADQDFNDKINKVIETFKPDVLHTHWLGHVALMAAIAERHLVPFTIRSHSFDVLAESSLLTEYCATANNHLCIGILCFPAFKQRLIDHGLQEEKLVSCWPVANYQRFYNPVKPERTHRILNLGAALPKKDYLKYIDFAHSMRRSRLEFNLYIVGNQFRQIRKYNEALGEPVKLVTTVDPKEMAAVYRDHDWLLYTSNPELNTVGFPLSIAEAQASGIGVCWQELPGRREEQLEYLGGAGFLFKSINELPALLQQPYPEEMRLKGLENAKKCDIAEHKILLTQLWDSVKKD